jgi:hypothetical protein
MRCSEGKNWDDVGKLEICRELGTPFRRERSSRLKLGSFGRRSSHELRQQASFTGVERRVQELDGVTFRKVVGQRVAGITGKRPSKDHVVGQSTLIFKNFHGYTVIKRKLILSCGHRG